MRTDTYKKTTVRTDSDGKKTTTETTVEKPTTDDVRDSFWAGAVDQIKHYDRIVLLVSLGFVVLDLTGLTSLPIVAFVAFAAAVVGVALSHLTGSHTNLSALRLWDAGEKPLEDWMFRAVLWLNWTNAGLFSAGVGALVVVRVLF